MIIIKATYGGVDCVNEIQLRVKNNQLLMRIDNSIIGDTMPGVVKKFEIEYEDNGIIYNDIITEGSWILLPKSNINRLGIFYSNNRSIQLFSTIRESLKSIQKASNGNVHIITNMWQRDPENPFIELISHTKETCHLNLVLQVLQTLYYAKEIGNYKYVSFLEHDVLYPEGYFDFPDFDTGVVLSNSNYIGMSKNGYQARPSIEPLHQMTMHFNDAINYFQLILPHALVTNEPYCGRTEPVHMKNELWRSQNASVHINNGRSFTSHYQTYGPGILKTTDEYWGSYSNYLHLF